jgi:cytidylate kinase
VPIVTVSRQFGAGGSALAARVAEALGWPLLDNALLDEVAARLGTSREEVAARDERRPSLAARLADALALGSTDAEPAVTAALPGHDAEGAAPTPTEERVLAATLRVIVDAAARGPVVVVGRGAQAALAERRDAVHVLCCAPREARVARVAEREGLAAAAAAQRVESVDRERGTLVRRRWGRELLDPAHYDVCLNTARLGLGRAAELVLQLVAERQARPPR